MVFRSSDWICIKALPNRQPETKADQQANAMMTYGGNPNPIKQIQQGPGFCSACGESHQLGKTCTKAIPDYMKALEKLFLKGVIMSNNKGGKGNPAHKGAGKAGGQFTTAEHAAAAHKEGDVAEPIRGRSPEGKARAQAAKEGGTTIPSTPTSSGVAPEVELTGPKTKIATGPKTKVATGSKTQVATGSKTESAIATGAVTNPNIGSSTGLGTADTQPGGSNTAPGGAVTSPGKLGAAKVPSIDRTANLSADIKAKHGDVEKVAVEAYHSKLKELEGQGITGPEALATARSHAQKTWDDQLAGSKGAPTQQDMAAPTMQDMAAPTQQNTTNSPPSASPFVQPNNGPFVGKQPPKMSWNQNHGAAPTHNTQTSTNPVSLAPAVSAQPPTSSTPIPSISLNPGVSSASSSGSSTGVATTGGQAAKPGGSLAPWAKYSTGAAVGSGLWNSGGTAQPVVNAGVQGLHGLLGYKDSGITPGQTASAHNAALKNETQRASDKLRQFSSRVA